MAVTRQIVIAALAACILSMAFDPAAFAALEKSSKKECALCHIMWLDAFRTDEETLIKWQPGNVLMKDTQGIVSSEEVCYSCHDGYVADSRYTVWKYKNHPVFKKPSKDMKIPAALTLSNKDEIYCGTCHSPHSGRQAAPGMSREETIPGPMSFLRLPDFASELCEACHKDEADFKRTGGHPVHTDKLAIPETLIGRGRATAEKRDMVTCQTCHRTHGAKGRHITVMDNSQSALCMACHKERTITGTMHDTRTTMPEETNLLGQHVSESGPCSACHVPHRSAGYKLWARKMEAGNPASQACLSCHRDGLFGKQMGVGRYSHKIDVPAVPKGQIEEDPTSQTIDLPVFSKSGRRQPEGTMQCATCHGVHQWNPDDPGDRGGKNAVVNASNSFLRIPASESSALCVQCHRDKWKILFHEHNLVLTAPDEENVRCDTAAESGPCGACHVPHNAGDRMLWASNPLPDEGAASLYCEGCHSQTGAAKAKTVGKYDHPVDVVLTGKNSPPPDQVIQKLPLYNVQGSTQGGTRIMCRTCHDPHTWSPDGASPETTDTAIKPVEGDAGNSFLRMASSPNADLCKVCHEDNALLVGTDHDLFITASSEKNRFGRTVSETGPCGACHAVHNSGQKRFLWAQTYGPVTENQHPMDRLCTGCHSNSGMAKEKIPTIATHPKGKLINNLLTSNSKGMGYIKLFDADWKEVNVGDLSCASCHSPHRWDHRVSRPAPGRNIEGNADTSFLRTSSDKAVCIDCHGQTAIWWYTYFHSLEKRVMLKGKQP